MCKDNILKHKQMRPTWLGCMKGWARGERAPGWLCDVTTHPQLPLLLGLLFSFCSLVGYWFREGQAIALVNKPSLPSTDILGDQLYRESCQGFMQLCSENFSSGRGGQCTFYWMEVRLCQSKERWAHRIPFCLTTAPFNKG